MAIYWQRSIVRGRTIDLSDALYLSDGTTGVAAEASDIIRFKVYRRDGATPLLDIDNSASAAGSVTTITSLTAPAQYNIHLAQGDTDDVEPGVYDAEVALVDDSETAPANGIKHLSKGCLTIRPGPGGDVGQA